MTLENEIIDVVYDLYKILCRGYIHLRPNDYDASRPLTSNLTRKCFKMQLNRPYDDYVVIDHSNGRTATLENWTKRAIMEENPIMIDGKYTDIYLYDKREQYGLSGTSPEGRQSDILKYWTFLHDHLGHHINGEVFFKRTENADNVQYHSSSEDS